MIWLLASLASGASLDNVEVGGVFGTPTTTDAEAIWWNPAGLAAGSGTRASIEAAPTLGTVQFDRVDPHGRGGPDTYRMAGVVPFLGVASDLGVPGLGVGGGVMIPYVRGGRETPEPGPGRFSMRDGAIRSAHAVLAAAYEPADVVSFGASLHLVQSSWTARLDTETLTGLAHNLEEAGAEPDYSDDQLEQPDYSATLEFGNLSDIAATFSGGVRVAPNERLALSVAYVHGYRVANRGDLDVAFRCPPQSDAAGRFGAEQLGLCHSTVDAEAEVAYRLPSRVNLGVSVAPTDGLVVSVLGGWVGWSVYRDFEVTVSDAQIEDRRARDSIEQERLWARDNRDSFWGAVDVKHDLTDAVMIGGRALYDRAAVPSHAMSPNNFDASALAVTGVAGWRPVQDLQLVASLGQHFVATRDVTDNAFGVTLDESAAKDDRWFYPQMNGTYRGAITRVGIGLRRQF